MLQRFVRPFLVFEFIVAMQAWLAFWSQVGGQYHLDLMFWPWKLGITVALAWLTCAITANLIRNEGAVSRRAIAYGSLLTIVVIVAGVVTYYYHVNEPNDEDNTDTPSVATEYRRS